MEPDLHTGYGSDKKVPAPAPQHYGSYDDSDIIGRYVF